MIYNQHVNPDTLSPLSILERGWGEVGFKKEI